MEHFFQNIDDQPSSNGLRSVDLNGTIQQLPCDASSHNGSSVLHEDFSNFCGISDDDMEKMQADCLSGIALQLLPKLKRHLKIIYSLNDARCQAYNPAEPPETRRSSFQTEYCL